MYTHTHVHTDICKIVELWRQACDGARLGVEFVEDQHTCTHTHTSTHKHSIPAVRLLNFGDKLVMARGLVLSLWKISIHVHTHTSTHKHSIPAVRLLNFGDKLVMARGLVLSLWKMASQPTGMKGHKK
jgi:hypothetical protein